MRNKKYIIMERLKDSECSILGETYFIEYSHKDQRFKTWYHINMISIERNSWYEKQSMNFFLYSYIFDIKLFQKTCHGIISRLENMLE